MAKVAKALNSIENMFNNANFNSREENIQDGIGRDNEDQVESRRIREPSFDGEKSGGDGEVATLKRSNAIRRPQWLTQLSNTFSRKFAYFPGRLSISGINSSMQKTNAQQTVQICVGDNRDIVSSYGDIGDLSSTQAIFTSCLDSPKVVRKAHLPRIPERSTSLMYGWKRWNIAVTR